MHKTLSIAIGIVLAVGVAGCKKKTAGEKSEPPEKGKADKQGKAPRVRPVPRAPRVSAGPFQRPTVTVRKTAKGGYEVEAVLKRSGKTRPPTGKVPFTAEPYTLTVTARGDTVEENNLFGTGLALDLDGDGKTTGRLKATCEPGGVATLGGTRIEPVNLPEATYRDDKGVSRVARIGKNGAHIILYNRCRGRNPVSFGVAPARKGGLPILEVDSPALQFLVAEEAAGPAAPVRIKISDLHLNGKPVRPAHMYSAHLYEPTFGKPGWAVCRWFMLPLVPDAAHHLFKFTVQGLNPASRSMVIVVLNLAGGKNTRVRSIVGVRRLTGR